MNLTDNSQGNITAYIKDLIQNILHTPIAIIATSTAVVATLIIAVALIAPILLLLPLLLPGSSFIF